MHRVLSSRKEKAPETSQHVKMSCAKLDILLELSQFDLEHLIFQILGHLSSLDLRCCQLVSSSWNFFVENLFNKRVSKGWDLGEPSKVLLQCEKNRAVCTISALSVDEQDICVGLGSSGDLECWNRRSLDRKWRCHAHDDGVYGVDMNADIIVSAGDDGLVKIFLRSNGDLLSTLEHHEYIVWTVKLWLDNLFTASYDCTVANITFKVSGKNFEVSQFCQIKGPEKWADALAADFTGRFLATHNEDTFELEIWDLKSTVDPHEMTTMKLTGHTEEVHCVIFYLCENLVLSGGADKSVRFWDLTNGSCVRVLTGHEGDVWCLDIDQNRIVSGGRYGEVKIWSRKVETGRSIWLHSRSTAIGRIKLEPTGLITTDGMGGILISDFWHFNSKICGCEKLLHQQPVHPE